MGQRREGLGGNAEGPCVPERPSDVLPDPQVYSKRAQPSCLTSFRKCKFSDIAKQGSSSASSELPLFLDRAGQEHPRAGSRHRFAPSRRGTGATAAEFRSRPRGREPLASSGQVGFLLRAAIGIGRIASSWDSLNSEQVGRGSSLTLTAHNLTLYGAPHRPYGGEDMLFACCLCSFRAKEGNPRLLWAYGRPRQ